MNNFPYNYYERLVPVHLNGRRLDFYTASLEDTGKEGCDQLPNLQRSKVESR